MPRASYKQPQKPRLQTNEVFDIERYRQDVVKYLQSTNTSYTEVSFVTGLSIPNLRSVFHYGVHFPSLATVCVMSDLCGLSIDDYRTYKEFS